MSAASHAPTNSPREDDAGYREMRFRHSRDFIPILESLHATLLISTYQAGKLVSVGASPEGPRIAMHNFEQAMGLALHPRRLAVGSRGVIWFLQNAADLAPRLTPPGSFDGCYLARGSFVTGNVHAHELEWIGDELWVVNTLFSCLCTLDDEFSFVPRWQPPFITALEGNDRCHLNGLAIADGEPKYVSVMADSNEPAGWRPRKSNSGQIIDVASGQAVTHGLSMPHSPRIYQGRLWTLNSGLGNLEIIDVANGQRTVVDSVPGYTRGLAFHGPFAFVGLSRIRETAVFGGVPIAERRDELKCGVAIIDLRIGRSVAYLEFETGVEEIFAVQVLPVRNVSITGPFPAHDDAQDVWIVPTAAQVPQLLRNRAIAGTSPTPFAASAPSQPPAAVSVAELVRRGLEQQQRGEYGAAVATFEQAVAAQPQSGELHNYLGNAWQEANQQDNAHACYTRAIAVEETFAPAHQNLGYLLINMGLLDEGRADLERAQQLRPAPVNRVILATSLPVIYGSMEEVSRRRQAMERDVRALSNEGVTLDTTNSLLPTNFFAAYQGYDDCPLQAELARIYRGLELVPPAGRQPRQRSGRIRVGFLSAHFRDHTIGRLNLGRVAHLDRARFEVTVISFGHHQDEMAQRFRSHADHYVEPAGSIQAMREQVAALDLDILLFADVGMNALTYTLAHSRMAGVQCVTWGHPVTTGSATMDYFVSSQLLETANADEHYTERLIRLANLGTYYHRPQLSGPLRGRASFGLDPAKHFYFCPQTLFKLHPAFDEILAGILRADPLGELVLIEGRQPQWSKLLRARFERSLESVAERVRFLPPVPNADFLQLNALADVLLDPIHFGGGNTSYEGLALGTPIVTLPGPFLRSRITAALYRKMGYMDCVVDTPAAYVEHAVRLGVDSQYRRAASDAIQATSDVLFDDLAEVRELERFFTSAARGEKNVWQ